MGCCCSNTLCPRNLFLVAPHVGVTSYKPDKEAIEKNYKARVNSSYIGRA